MNGRKSLSNDIINEFFIFKKQRVNEDAIGLELTIL